MRSSILGSLGGSDAYVNGMSANGTVVVGSSSTANGQTHAYKHTDSGGMVDLGTLGGSNSGASAISTDGTVIVGYAETANGATHAALWKNDIIVDSTNTRAALALTASARYAQRTAADADAAGLFRWYC
jgi:probable HAF family extracellular repeat protein